MSGGVFRNTNKDSVRRLISLFEICPLRFATGGTYIALSFLYSSCTPAIAFALTRSHPQLVQGASVQGSWQETTEKVD